MPNNSAKRVTRDARVRKLRAGNLMRPIWAKRLRAALEKARAVSKRDTHHDDHDDDDDDDERGKSPPMPTDHRSHHLADGSQQPSSMATGSSSATEASLAPATSSTTSSLLPPNKSLKKVRENLRVMQVGEPGRLALLASTYSSAKSRARLTKPGEPEITWEEVKAAVRESPPLKRKFNRDEDDTDEEPPRPAKMSRFEERTARVKVYDPPKNPFTTYHPTKPRRTHALPTDDDEEELHCRKKRRYNGPPSIFGPNRTHTGDLLTDAKGDESSHHQPKEANWSVLFNCKRPSEPKAEVESSLRPAQAIAGIVSVPVNEFSPSSPKVQPQAEKCPPQPAVASAVEPSSLPTNGSHLSIPEPQSSPTAANSDKEGDLTLVSLESVQYSQARARNYLRWIRRQTCQSYDQRLAKKMAECDRLLEELGPIKHTGTRPTPSLHNDDSNNVDEDKKKVSSPPVYKGDQNEPSHTTVEKITQGGDEAIRRAGLSTAAEKEVVVVQAQRAEAKLKKEREALIKMRKRFSRAPPGKGSPLKRSVSVSVSESESKS